MFSQLKGVCNLVMKCQFYAPQMFLRHFSVTQINYLKEIKVTKNGDTTIIEAIEVPSPRSDKLVSPPSSSHTKSCPLCRLNLKRLSHTDVLILNQFVESNGKLMPKDLTGLCNRQYNKVKRLVLQAQRCQLIPRPLDYEINGPWDSLNTYYEYPQRFRDQPMKILKPEYWR